MAQAHRGGKANEVRNRDHMHSPYLLGNMSMMSTPLSNLC